MDSRELGRIAYKVNTDLIHLGLTDADISFVGMCLLSYSIAQTTQRIMESKNATGLVKEP